MVNYEKAVNYSHLTYKTSPNGGMTTEPQMAIVHPEDPNIQYSPFVLRTPTAEINGMPSCLPKNNCIHQQNMYNRPPPHVCGSYDMSPSTGPKSRSYRYTKRSLEPKQVDYAARLSEIKLDKEKSPVAKLNEIMAIQKFNVEYTLVSMSGQVHSPLFTYRVKGGDMVVYGTGKSKKDAKQNAAIEYLEKLDCAENNAITSTTRNRSCSPTVYEAPQKIMDTKSDINPIGVLQELCMARHWQLPEYDFPQEDIIGEPHNRLYRVTCTILTYRTQGEGKTKQGAKRQAARFMYDLMKNLSREQIEDLSYNEPSNQTSANEISSKKQPLDIKKEPMQFVSTDALKQVEKFFNQLKKSEKPCLNALNNLKSLDELKPGAVDLLDKIGNEEGFRTSYVMLSNKSNHVTDIMVQVSINPVMVYVGSGASISEAQEAAAFAALVYFKLMLEK